MALLVWPEAPYKVLANDDNQILGFHGHELVGRSAMILTGPQTDTPLFQLAIINTKSLQSTKLRVFLYDRNREEQQVVVCFSPLLLEGIFVGCLTLFQPSPAVTIQKVLDTIKESGYAQCLVSLESPHDVHVVNEAFLSKFGCPRDLVLGKPLPLLASLLHGSSPHQWNSLLQEAGDGTIQRRSIGTLGNSDAANRVTAAPFEEVIFVPVADAPNGRICHVLVIFPPAILPAPSLPAPPPCSYPRNLLDVPHTAAPAAPAAGALADLPRTTDAELTPRRNAGPGPSGARPAGGRNCRSCAGGGDGRARHR